MSNISKFARSPQGKKLARQAKDVATDPKTKRKIEEVRKDMAARKSPSAEVQRGSARWRPQLGEQQLGVHRADELAQRLGARGDDLGRAVDLDLAGQAVEQHADLLARPAAAAPRGSAACRRP